MKLITKELFTKNTNITS